MIGNHSRLHFVLAAFLVLTAASVASAASNLSNSLTGFTGDSTQPATQSAVAAAGLNFFEFGDAVTKVNFDSAGAHFGTGQPDFEGRNYMRTSDSDYANVNFVAEITMVAPDIDIQDAYVGLGAGDANLDFFRTPDRLTNNSSIMYWGEVFIDASGDFPSSLEVLRNDNGGTFSIFTVAPTLSNGTHRLRLTYDRFRKVAEFAFDLNYAGGPFVADHTLSQDASILYGPDGWPTEPSRIYFGGDEDMAFKDFNVTVLTAPIAKFGDLDSDNDIDPADWAIQRDNRHRNLSNLSQTAAYLLGDMNGNLTNDANDFIYFKTLYDDANGAGAFDAMLASVPEPSVILLILSAGLLACPARWRAGGRV